MTSPQRWEPDAHIVAAVLSSPRASRGMTQLPDADRAWLVAGLTLAGLTAKDIAERLDCSLRLVRSIRAEPMTQLCVLMQTAEKTAADDLRAEKIDHMATRGLLNEARAGANRALLQRDQLLAKVVKGERVPMCPKNHPMVGYNVYCHDGRQKCRECNRLRVAEHRKVARRKRSEQRCNPMGLPFKRLPQQEAARRGVAS